MSYNPDVDQEFWKFSFHEIGMYDFPAIIDYVLGITQEEQVFFIAHSVSTTAFYVMCSERPEYNRKIKAHISLAPAAHMKHTKNPFLYLMSQFVGTWDVRILLLRLYFYYNIFFCTDNWSLTGTRRISS